MCVSASDILVSFNLEVSDTCVPPHLHFVFVINIHRVLYATVHSVCVVLVYIFKHPVHSCAMVALCDVCSSV